MVFGHNIRSQKRRPLRAQAQGEGIERLEELGDVACLMHVEEATEDRLY